MLRVKPVKLGHNDERMAVCVEESQVSTWCQVGQIWVNVSYVLYMGQCIICCLNLTNPECHQLYPIATTSDLAIARIVQVILLCL